MANIIERTQRPTLVLAHNKTLAAAHLGVSESFPDSAVSTLFPTMIIISQKPMWLRRIPILKKIPLSNEEIDKLRHSATSALFERRDVIIVASVSCIYGLGKCDEYKNLSISLRPGMTKDRDDIIRKLIEIQYERNDIDFARGSFRVRGDILDVILPMSPAKASVLNFFGDEIDRIREFDVLTGEILHELSHTRYFSLPPTLPLPMRICNEPSKKSRKRWKRGSGELNSQDKLLEAQRLRQRTNFDIEMMMEMGYCSGIENYSENS